MYEYTITISLTLPLPDSPTFEDISRAVEGDPDNARYTVCSRQIKNYPGKNKTEGEKFSELIPEKDIRKAFASWYDAAKTLETKLKKIAEQKQREEDAELDRIEREEQDRAEYERLKAKFMGR
jgi:hypothetical protein